MGALGNSGDGRIFLNTFKGSFTRRANSETEGAVSRKISKGVNKGKEIWELQFNTLSDIYIQEFERRSSDDYGYSWNIKLAHAKSDETFTLTMPYSGRITMGLFLRLPNVDINKQMTLRLHYFEAEDKSALVVWQDNNKIEAFWTKDDPKGMPELIKSVKDGKDVWDSTDRMKFLENYLEKDLNPTMNAGEYVPVDEDVNQDEPKTEEPPQTQEEAVSTGEAEWDANAKCLKRKHLDDNYYQCDEDGKFLRDQEGKMIGVLPF